MRSALLALLLPLACGGSGAKASVTVPPPDAGAPKSSTTFLTTPPPSGLPPMANMPAPGVAGSKKGKRRPDAALAACTAAPPSGAPEAQVKKLGESCAAPSKMKPVGALLRGEQGDKDAPQENAFRVEANKCYRVYVASDAKDVVVVLRDSHGDIVVESPAPAIPDDGAVCFTESDQVALLVGVGSGRGAWVAQVWSN
jgi:hypothetical protein